MKNIFKDLGKKSFYLEFQTLDNPTENEIVQALMEYGKKRDENIDFISKTMPITFSLDKTQYVVKRGTSRGGPTVRCVAV